jgi:hypothetical protein
LLVLRDIKNYKEFKKIQLEKDHIKYVKFNPVNSNEYFVCWENDFKIYDIRTYNEIQSRPEFRNSIDIFNDSSQYLLAYSNKVNLYEKDLVREWNQFNDISHINMNPINHTDPEIIIIGTNSGDLYYA